MGSESWLTLKIEYQKSKIGTVMLEDKTHVVIQFDDGTKLCTEKSGMKNKIVGDDKKGTV